MGSDSLKATQWCQSWDLNPEPLGSLGCVPWPLPPCTVAARLPSGALRVRVAFDVALPGTRSSQALPKLPLVIGVGSDSLPCGSPFAIGSPASWPAGAGNDFSVVGWSRWETSGQLGAVQPYTWVRGRA
jgi:hypothetical protein